MKRKMCSLILAIVTFIAAYMIMSFAIPGFRIKLEAEPAVVFVETLKILWPFKAAVSLIAAVLIGGLPLVLGKRKEEKASPGACAGGCFSLIFSSCQWACRPCPRAPCR